MKRPVAVIISAILLGLLAALQLLLGLVSVAAGFVILHKGLPVPAAPMPSPIPPSFLPVMMFAFSLFYAALAAWSIWTLVGLVRMRSWARYSVLVMAGCVTFFGGISALASFALPFLMRSMIVAPQPAPNPVRGIFIFTGLIYFLFAAAGIAFLIYYNLASTRALFLQNAPVNPTPPNTSNGRPRPTAITILSWFFLISGPFLLVYAFFPLPAFLLGFAFNGLAAHVFYAAFAAMGFAIGYGLFRLRPEAPVAFLAWVIFGFFNMLAILTPWGARNFRTYMEKFIIHNSMAPTPNLSASRGIVLASLLFATAINLFCVWLLHRHRDAFTPAPPPPPIPMQLPAPDAPYAG